MRRAVALAAASAAVLSVPAPALAGDRPVFGSPATLGPSGQHPGVALGPEGDAVVVWIGQDGVYAARRPAGGGTFSDPALVAAEPASSVAVARNARGDTAVVWTRTASMGDSAPRVAMAPAGGAFGPPEDVPVPAREREPGVNAPAASYGPPSVAVAGDGTAAVGYLEQTYDAPASAVVSVRPPAGPLRPAQVLGAGSGYDVKLAADGGSGLYALWTGGQPGADRSGPNGAWFAQRSGDDFGSPRMLSGAAISTPDATLGANARGDLVAAWSAAPVAGYGYPDSVETTFRPQGLDWEAPERFVHVAIPRPAAAVNEAGDASVTWASQPDRLMGTFRPAGGEFGEQSQALGPQTSNIYSLPLALDSLGTTIATWTAGRGSQQRIVATLRRRGGQFGDLVDVSPLGDLTSDPRIATDRFGNGLVVWTGGPRGGTPAVNAAAYSANPPAVTGLKVTAEAVSFRVDEPARVRVKLARAGGKSAAVKERARAGRNSVTLSAPMQRLLRRGGRFRATVRAADAGPRAARRVKSFRR